MVLIFFVLKIQKVCFLKKYHLADLMAHWVCCLHNLYFAQKSAFFVRFALLYKDVFFWIDARSELDSQDGFSRGEVILVAINSSRHWFRMDLSFNQFSLTERPGLFSEKEVQQLLICCLIALYFVVVGRRRRILVNVSQQTIACDGYYFFQYYRVLQMISPHCHL